LLDPALLAGALRGLPPHTARFLRGMARRLERITVDPEKDQRKFDTIAPLLGRAAQTLPRTARAQRERLSYLLQELRIATFAPELRTAEPVSIKRVENMLESLVAADDGQR
jgi:ATP-dependent helicase HrpA